MFWQEKLTSSSLVFMYAVYLYNDRTDFFLHSTSTFFQKIEAILSMKFPPALNSPKLSCARKHALKCAVSAFTLTVTHSSVCKNAEIIFHSGSSEKRPWEFMFQLRAPIGKYNNSEKYIKGLWWRTLCLLLKTKQKHLNPICLNVLLLWLRWHKENN